MPPLDGKRVNLKMDHTDPDVDVQVRMESLARMGTALSSDLVPLLTVLNNILQLARVGLENGGPAKQAALNSLTTADRAMESATTLVRRLEEFGRNTSGRPERIDLSSFVKSRAPCMARTLGSSIDLEIKTADEPTPVDFDPRRLEQILSEILRNACEAMRGVGGIVVRIEHHQEDEIAPPLVRLIIDDDGPGMDASMMMRSLEPFFTTKHHDVGIGLGLPMSYATVNAGGGRFALSSNDAGGIRVAVDLPLQSTEESALVEINDIVSFNSGSVDE